MALEPLIGPAGRTARRRLLVLFLVLVAVALLGAFLMRTWPP